MNDNANELHSPQTAGTTPPNRHLILDSLAHKYVLEILQEQVSVLSSLISVAPDSCAAPHLSPLSLAHNARRITLEAISALEEARPLT